VTDAVTALLLNTPTRLQASQNRTNGCNTGSSTPVTTPTTPTGPTTTTTTVPGSTVPPPNASGLALLKAAQAEFDAAGRALAAGDLGSYQAHIRNAQADFEAYRAKVDASSGSVPAATTTVPGTTPTTGAP
jgi:hypothetical protein